MTPLKIGIIGFDTSHVPAFTWLLSDETDPHHVSGARIVAGVATFIPDLEASVSRVQGFTDAMRDHYGVTVLGSIEEMIEAPLAIEETLEIMAFMRAALVSTGEGREVALAEITERETHANLR